MRFAVRRHIFSGAYSKSCPTFKMKCFKKIFNGGKTLNIFAKDSMLDV